MRFRSPGVALLGGLIAGLVLATAWAPVAGDEKTDEEQQRQVEALRKRLDVLEKVVGQRLGDTVGPSLAERLATLEKGLSRLSHAAGKPRWSSAEHNLRELESLVRTTARRQSDLAQRLSQLERDLRAVTGSARELREIRSALGRVERELRDLENRVRRLESRP